MRREKKVVTIINGGAYCDDIRDEIGTTDLLRVFERRKSKAVPFLSVFFFSLYIYIFFFKSIQTELTHIHTRTHICPFPFRVT